MNIILNKNYKRNIVENLYLNAFPETERRLLFYVAVNQNRIEQ